jgi:hypothetical protein
MAEKMIGQKREREEDSESDGAQQLKNHKNAVQSQRRTNAKETGKTLEMKSREEIIGMASEITRTLFGSKHGTAGPLLTQPFGGCKGLVALMVARGILDKIGETDYYILNSVLNNSGNVINAINLVSIKIF